MLICDFVNGKSIPGQLLRGAVSHVNVQCRTSAVLSPFSPWLIMYQYIDINYEPNKDFTAANRRVP